MNARTEQVDDLQLVALPSAVSCAEIFVRFSLTEWALRTMQDQAVEVARLMVGEAVENSDPSAPGVLTVRLKLRGSDLVVEVEGAQVGQPPRQAGVRTGVVGLRNGLQLAWCELPLPAGMNASAVPLPRRDPRPSPAAAQLGDEPDGMDEQLMQRILFGLNGSPER